MSDSKTRLIKKGDKVTIKPEWRDPGDEMLTWVACEDEDGGRVKITPVDIGLKFPPYQVVRVSMLEPRKMIPFVIFSASEANASSDRSGFWSGKFGWTTLENANRYDEAFGDVPTSVGNDAVWMLSDGLVDSPENAIEQAENACPGSRVVGTLEPFQLIVDAHACDEHGDGPGYAVINVDSSFIERIEKMLMVCKTYDLESVTASSEPDAWGDGEDELQLRGDALIVWADGRFWFSARPKHVDYQVESRGVDIAWLRQVAEAGADAPLDNDCSKRSSGTLYFSGDAGRVSDLIDLVEDSSSRRKS